MSRFQCFFFCKSSLETIKNIKNVHFNKIIKGTVTSFQSPPLSQRYVTNVGHIAH